MKLRHLSGRFTRALWPAPPRAGDLAWVESVLTPGINALRSFDPPISAIEGSTLTGITRRGKLFVPGKPHAQDRHGRPTVGCLCRTLAHA